MHPTEKAEDGALILYLEKNEEEIRLNKGQFNNNGKWVGEHLYITSADELKTGDWIYSVLYGIGKIDRDYGGNDKPLIAKFLNSTTQQMYERNGIWQKGQYEDVSAHNCKKIIATTNPDLINNEVGKIRENFLENVFIPQYNKGNIIDEVMVEFDKYWNVDEDFSFKTLSDDSKSKLSPKLRADGTIIIHKKKDVFTLDDIKNAIRFGFVLGEELEPSFYKDHDLFKERMEQWIDEQN